MSDINIGGLVGALAILVRLIAEATGKTEAEVLAEVDKDCAARAKDPTDESDRARAEVEADLPNGTSER